MGRTGGRQPVGFEIRELEQGQGGKKLGATSIGKKARGAVGIALALCLISACVAPQVLGTLLEVSVNAAMDRRDRQQVFDDGVEQVQLGVALLEYFSLSHLVYNDIAYVIGYVDSAEEKAEVLETLADGDYGRPETLILIKDETSPSFVSAIKSKTEITSAIIKESDLSFFNIHILTANDTAFLIGDELFTHDSYGRLKAYKICLSN